MHEVKTLFLESVNVWKNYKKRIPSKNSAGVSRPIRSAQGTNNVYSELSGLEDVGFNDFIKDDCIPEGDDQVASGSAFSGGLGLQGQEGMKNILMSWTTGSGRCLS